MTPQGPDSGAWESCPTPARAGRTPFCPDSPAPAPLTGSEVDRGRGDASVLGNDSSILTSSMSEASHRSFQIIQRRHAVRSPRSSARSFKTETGLEAALSGAGTTVRILHGHSPVRGEKRGGTGHTAARLSAPAAPGVREAAWFSWQVLLLPCPSPPPGEGATRLRHTGQRGLHAGRSHTSRAAPPTCTRQAVLAFQGPPDEQRRVTCHPDSGCGACCVTVQRLQTAESHPDVARTTEPHTTYFPPKTKPQLSDSRPILEEN